MKLSKPLLCLTILILNISTTLSVRSGGGHFGGSHSPASRGASHGSSHGTSHGTGSQGHSSSGNTHSTGTHPEGSSASHGTGSQGHEGTVSNNGNHHPEDSHASHGTTSSQGHEGNSPQTHPEDHPDSHGTSSQGNRGSDHPEEPASSGTIPSGLGIPETYGGHYSGNNENNNNGEGSGFFWRFLLTLVGICTFAFAASVVYYRYQLKKYRMVPFAAPSFCPKAIFPPAADVHEDIGCNYGDNSNNNYRGPDQRALIEC